MFIHCVNSWWYFGHVYQENFYCPGPSEVAEVKDLWYERRKGPSERDREAARVWGKLESLPPRGQFSALCHASFSNETMIFQGNLPEDSGAIDRQFQVSHGTAVEVDVLLPSISGNASGQLYHYQYLGEQKIAIVNVSISGISAGNPSAMLRTSGSAYYIRSVSWDVRSRSYVAVYGQWNFDSGWFNCESNRWTADTVLDHVRALLDSAPDPGQWSETRGSTRPGDSSTVGDVSTIVREAQAQLYSALRYNDLELVDYSVSPSGSRPWAFSNVDFLNGRAASYVEALDDIPRACDNQLQNIVAVLSMLEMIAFESNELFSKWCDAKYPKLNLSKQLKGDWYRTNRWGQSQLQVLYSRFKSTTSQILDQTCIDEFLAAKRDQFGELSSAWLQGRYVLTTSVSDLGQAWDYWYDQACTWLGTRSASKKCHGSVELESGRFQCSMTVQEKALPGIVKFFELAYTHGMEPNAYVLWDLVPFSFIVDWFYPVGNAFEGYTKSTHYTPELWDYLPRYDGNAMCYSVSYVSQTASFGSIDVYTRWYESGPPLVEPAYILQAEQSKARVLCPSSFCASKDVKEWDDDVSKRIEQRQKEFDRNARRTIDLIALF